jgi:hypothetical protein
MTRSIRIGDIGNYCEQQVEQLLRATVLEADRRLKERSPVDTGRLRMSWQIGENSAGGTPAAPGNYRGMASPPVAINYQAGQERLGNVYSIHNNLPYAEPVVMGTGLPPSWGGVYRTRQGTVPGFPDLVAREVQRFVRTGWEAIKRRG